MRMNNAETEGSKLNSKQNTNQEYKKPCRLG